MRIPIFLLTGFLVALISNPAIAGIKTAALDSMDQRVLACTSCHGPQGRSIPGEYVPRIAGKPANYLFNQLQSFRDGRRLHTIMQRLIRHLSDDYLREIAIHFSVQTVDYAQPEPASLSASRLQRGKRLAMKGDPARELPACAECHGQALTGMQPSVPGLLGLPRDYLLAQLGAWRLGQRRAHAPDCMAKIVDLIAPDDLVMVVDWLAVQVVKGQGKPAAKTALPLPLPCGRMP